MPNKSYIISFLPFLLLSLSFSPSFCPPLSLSLCLHLFMSLSVSACLSLFLSILTQLSLKSHGSGTAPQCD